MKNLLLSIIIIFIYFPVEAQDYWEQKSNYGGGGRYSGIGFSIGGSGYIGTGFVGINAVNDFWRYDTLSDSWTQISDIPTIRFNAFSFVIDSMGYVGSGSSGIGSTPTETFFRYNPDSNVWTARADFPEFTAGAVGMSLNLAGYVYDFTSINNFYKYDPLLNVWMNVANYPGTPRDAVSTFSFGNKGYLVSGWLGSEPHQDVWEYDASTDIWTQKNNFPGAAVWDGISFTINGRGYLGLGIDSTGTRVTDFWEYDPSIDTWTMIASFPGTSRDKAAGFSIGMAGFVGTGTTSSDFWKYYPLINSKTELENLEMNFYPNPAIDKLQITSGIHTSFQFKIFNLNGIEVFDGEFENRTEINLSSFNPGIYYCVVKNKNQSIRRKIVIQ